MTDSQFTVEAARTGRSSCKNKKCPSKPIAKEALRIGRLKTNPFDDDGESQMVDWFHAACWFDQQSRLRATSKKVASEADLKDFESLDDAAKTLLRGYITGRRPFAQDIAKLAASAPPAPAPPATAGPAKRKRDELNDEDDADDGSDADAAPPPAKQSQASDGRPVCRYGADCYRSNADHRLAFWHPGDAATAAAAAAASASAPAAASPVRRKLGQQPLAVALRGNCNEALSRPLEELGAFEKSMGNGTKHKVYVKAATALRMLERPVTSGADARSLDGIGEKIAAKIDEILATGRLEALERRRADPIVSAVHLLCSVDGIGPVLARRLVEESGVRTLADLEPLAEQLNNYQRVGLRYHAEFRQRIPRAEVEALESLALAAIPAIDPQLQATVCGSYRRGLPSCGDIDMLLTHPSAGTDARGVPLLDVFVAALRASGFITHELGLGEHKCTAVCQLPASAAAGGVPALHRRIDILWVPWDEYYYAQLYFTGSAFFNLAMRRVALDRGLTLNEHGLWPLTAAGDRDTTAPHVRVSSEREIFDILGMEYRTPHERDIASTWKPDES